ncbi:MAG TPA: dihydrodipicolinate synthase family protein [Sedimentisphaerales bacterium]|nr:dihydrodipicolinate synthase family protein [Sedimentisphaerales bacterium]
MPMKPKELKDKIRGVVHLVMTHFDENDQLDEKAIRKSVNHAANALQGVDAVFLTTASTAEFYAMTDEENKKAITIVVEETAGRFPVIAGTGRPGTKWTIEMSRFAQQTGADGVLIVNPYYQLPTEQALFRHFEEIAESIDIGIMIYNNPVTTKLWIPPDLMAGLSKIENIIADKENSSNALTYYWMQKAIDPQDMVVICGIGQLMYPFYAVYGCPAFVTEFANFAPEIAVNLYQAAQERDFDKMAQLSDTIAPYHQFLAKLAQKRGAVPSLLPSLASSNELPLYQSVIKSAMSLVGLPGGPVRGPSENITAEEKEQLRQVLKEMGVL